MGQIEAKTGRVGSKQRMALEMLAEFGGSSGWSFDSKAEKVRVLESLEVRGLSFSMEKDCRHGRYRFWGITEAGRAALAKAQGGV